MPVLAYTIIPVVAVIAGALLSLLRKPGASWTPATTAISATR